MKQDELKKCAYCGQGVMHSGSPVFYRVTVEHFLVDMGAVQRRHGLELMVGSPVLAAVMGPDEDIAKPFNKVESIVCLDCLTRRADVMKLSEKD